MPRLHAIAPALVLCLAPACDRESVMIDRQLALTDRVEALEVQVKQLEARLNALAEESPRVRPAEPEARAPPVPPARPGTVLVEVTPGELRVDGEAMNLAGLAAHIRDRRAREPGLAVAVRAVASVEYTRVVEVLDAAKLAGATTIALESAKTDADRP